jgi:hypothetical protein
MSKTRNRPSSNGLAGKTRKASRDPDKQAALMAQQIIRPSVTAACTMKRLHGQEDPCIDLAALVQELSGQVKAVADGNMSRTEAMLVTQAHTLDTLFSQLTQRAALNTSYKGGKRAQSLLTDELGRIVKELCERAQAGDKAALKLIVGQVWPPMSKLFDFVRKEAGAQVGETEK